MIHKVLWMASLFLCYGLEVASQEDSTSNAIALTGRVMDNLGAPIKGALVFVDSINSKQKTDKNGFYRITIQPGVKLLSVYSKVYGLLSMEYAGQDKISFLYKDDETMPMTKSELRDKGFKLRPNTDTDTGWYADFPTILEILDKRFFFASVRDGKVLIGKGTNQVYSETDPLVYVDDQRLPISVLSTIPTSDVKLIRVIHKGSEAAEYGGIQANNGVILITLKKS